MKIVEWNCLVTSRVGGDLHSPPTPSSISRLRRVGLDSTSKLDQLFTVSANIFCGISFSIIGCGLPVPDSQKTRGKTKSNQSAVRPNQVPRLFHLPGAGRWKSLETSLCPAVQSRIALIVFDSTSCIHKAIDRAVICIVGRIFVLFTVSFLGGVQSSRYDGDVTHLTAPLLSQVPQQVIPSKWRPAKCDMRQCCTAYGVHTHLRRRLRYELRYQRVSVWYSLF